MMATGMQNAAGDRLRRILEVLTTRPIIGVLTGVLITMLIQSSGATTVMVVGFANAGLITLSQAISVIIGANIGTTVTAQIIAFKIEEIAFPIIGLGALIIFFSRRRQYRYLGEAILGMGLLFLGISTMAAGLEPLKDLPAFHGLLSKFGTFPLLGVIGGALFTAALQSSSAFTGVIIALSMQGMITLSEAIPLILGSNIGTCVIAFIASAGTNVTARRAAMAHIYFNVIGVVLCLFILTPFTSLVLKTASTVTRQIANAHSIFNVFNSLFFILILPYFARFISYIVPGEEVSIGIGPNYLDKRMLPTPAAAIQGSKKELLRMAMIAREITGEAISAFVKNDLKKGVHIDQMEDLLDSLEEGINIYLAELSQNPLAEAQSKMVASFMSAANDLERIGDHATNIKQLAELKVEERLPFSEQALEELSMIYEKINVMLERAIQAFDTENKPLARMVIVEDDQVDLMEKVLRKAHIERINTKKCYPPSGVIYLDVLSNMERIADHATNIAQLVVEDF
ncbi:MAG: Na/Pi cotransporter family protein [Firmicutes bacterium]|nr:Na/Pi cotransporter family protein [Bacillota bacterium]